MSYFDPDLTKKRASNVIGTPHLKKDVGVIEGFKAQRDNTYGVMEEQAIQNRAMGPVMDFVIENSGSRFTAPSSAEFTNDAWQALSRLKAEGVEVPERFAFDSQDDFFADALRQEAERYKERQSRVAKTTGLGGVGAFVGGVVGSMNDIENIATLPLGATGRMGIAMTSLVEGGVNAGLEGATFGPRQKLLADMGIESRETRLGAMATGFVGGAVLGGGLRTATGPEIYQLVGGAIQRMGARKAAKVLQKSDDPTVSVNGHAIEDELNAKAHHKYIVERERGAPAAYQLEANARVDDAALLGRDVDFLNEVEAGRFDFETRISETIQAVDNGTVPVRVLTSDGVTHNLDIAADIARTSDLINRFDEGNAIPISELDDLGIRISENATTRRVMEYYDLMDARFRGQEVPDKFEAIDDVDFDAAQRDIKFEGEIAASLSARKAHIDRRNIEADTIRIATAEPIDFGNNLSRLARAEGSGAVRTIGSLQSGLSARTSDVRRRKSEADAIRFGYKTGISLKDAAKESAKLSKIAKKYRKQPVIDKIKNKGGIKPGTSLASDLSAMGITSRTVPGLFRNSGLGDVDNLDDLGLGALVSRDGNYLDRQDIIDAMGEEISGNPRLTDEQSDILDKIDWLNRTVDEGTDQFDEISKTLNEDVTELLGDIKEVTVATESGGFENVPLQRILNDLAEDSEFAEQIKLCGLQ